MALRSYAFIFLSPGFDANKHVATMESDSCHFKTVGIDINHKEQVVDVAKQLAAEGVQMIELCGGFGPYWVTKVSEAIGDKIPVGGVAYGPEWRKPILDILA